MDETDLIQLAEQVRKTLQQGLDELQRLRKGIEKARGPSMLGSPEFVRWNIAYGSFSLAVPPLNVALGQVETTLALLKRTPRVFGRQPSPPS